MSRELKIIDQFLGKKRSNKLASGMISVSIKGAQLLLTVPSRLRALRIHFFTDQKYHNCEVSQKTRTSFISFSYRFILCVH